MTATIRTSPLDALSRLGEPPDTDDGWRVTDEPETAGTAVETETPRRGARAGGGRRAGAGKPAPADAGVGVASEAAAGGSKAGAAVEVPGEAEAGARDAASVATGPATPVPVVVSRRARWLSVLLAVLAVLGLAGTAFFARAWWGQRSSQSQTASQTTQVRTAADGFVTALTNFDPGTVDADFGRIQGYATASFATQAKQFFSSSIRSELQTAGAASRGQVQDLFIESLSGNQATVFAVVDQTYVNDKMTTPSADTLRLELGMTQLKSGWKISTVTVVQSPAGFPTTGATTPPKS
jgi:hypothetical protein